MATVAFLLNDPDPLSVVAGCIDEGMSALILLAVPLSSSWAIWSR